MGYFQLNKLPKEKRIRMIGEFYDLIASLKNRKEVREFLKDLLTPNEIGNLMRRIEVALLLYLGLTYEEIQELLGVGREKIARVKRKLEKGKGYHFIIQRLIKKRKKKEIKNVKSRLKLARMVKSSPFNIEYFKKKYPSYFLIINLIDELVDHLKAVSEIKSLKEKRKNEKIL